MTLGKRIIGLALAIALTWGGFLGWRMLVAEVLAQGSPGQEVTSLAGTEQIPLGYPCTVSCFAKASTFATFARASNQGVNAQTGTSYTVVAADLGKTLTFSNAGTVTVTIPVCTTTGSFVNGAKFSAVNLGTGNVVLTPTTSTINGSATLTMPTGRGTAVVCDGANYQIEPGGGSLLATPAKVSEGGTGLASGTSGGFPAYTAAGTIASTGAIAANHAVTGGGAGATPIDSLVTLTKPATGATLTIADGKTLTANNSLTLAGTDTTTMTFPSTSATIARTDAGQTFTGVNNFTAPGLTNPVIIGPAPVACGASCSPTAGQLITFAVNSGGTATLPTSSGSGNVIRLRVTITQASATIKVLLTTTSDVIIGTAIGENAGTAKVFVGNAAANHSIAMPFAGTQPSGGFNGDLITCTDMATGTWACDITYQAGTTPTTPYSTSTS